MDIIKSERPFFVKRRSDSYPMIPQKKWRLGLSAENRRPVKINSASFHDSSAMILVLVKVNSAGCERLIIHEDVVISSDCLDDFYRDSDFCTEAVERKNDGVSSDSHSIENFESDVFLLQRCKDNGSGDSRIVHVFKLCSCAVQLFQNKWRPFRVTVDGRRFSCIMHATVASDIFRRNLINRLISNRVVAKRKLLIPCCFDEGTKHLQMEINLTWPEHLAMDKAWNNRMLTLIEERKELEVMMAWLSTLGGAYSALGDDFYHCAEVAGKISLKQLKIALKLGDPITLAKCKVYFAISLVQRDDIKRAVYIIRQQFAYAKSLPENLQDTRLINMCKGVWARLQYVRLQKLRSTSKKVSVN